MSSEPAEPSDQQLIAQAVAGDRAAYDIVVRRHSESVARCLWSLIGDADEAESLTQEALTRAWQQRADYRPEHEFRAWVMGIGINLARNHLRSRARHARPVEPEQLGTAPDKEGRNRGVLSAILQRELEHQVVAAIGQLPLSLREPFVLHALEGLDYDTIAGMLDVAAGTLRVRIHRARTLLKTQLGSLLETWVQSTNRHDD